MSCEATFRFHTKHDNSYDLTVLQAASCAHTFGDGPFFGRIASVALRGERHGCLVAVS